MKGAGGHTEAVRGFNRFYTGRIGIIPEDYLGSRYTLAQARVIYELGHLGRDGASSATELGRALELDLGYLSRLLQGLKQRGLLRGKRSPRDGRRSLLALTPKGRKSYLALDAKSRKEIGGLLAPLPESDRTRLVGAMRTVEALLKNEKPQIELRSHRPGDMGWVVHSHGRRYFEEYGWDERFEALVAGITKDFVENFDPARERCWIAEMDGEPVGSVFLAKSTKAVAKLRLLLIEPRARGLGLGKRLVAECIAFARAKGYRTLGLWTQSNLAAARHIYRSAGFRLAKRQRHREFGYDLTGEFWQIDLS
jgi:DNA-binding MarR family transcriptional regulator/GNAT superfamily N-acetyltransferase